VTIFQIAGSGDFNDDGNSDVLWRDTSGNVAIWFMNGTTVPNPNTAGSELYPSHSRSKIHLASKRLELKAEQRRPRPASPCARCS
jgi:hypothetical protein